MHRRCCLPDQCSLSDRERSPQRYFVFSLHLRQFHRLRVEKQARSFSLHCQRCIGHGGSTCTMRCSHCGPLHRHGSLIWVFCWQRPKNGRMAVSCLFRHYISRRSVGVSGFHLTLPNARDIGTLGPGSGTFCQMRLGTLGPGSGTRNAGGD